MSRFNASVIDKKMFTIILFKNNNMINLIKFSVILNFIKISSEIIINKNNYIIISIKYSNKYERLINMKRN